MVGWGWVGGVYYLDKIPLKAHSSSCKIFGTFSSTLEILYILCHKNIGWFHRQQSQLLPTQSVYFHSFMRLQWCGYHKQQNCWPRPQHYILGHFLDIGNMIAILHKCVRPDWHSQSHANFHPQSRGCILVTFGQLPLRPPRVKTPDLPIFETAVAAVPYRGTLQVKLRRLKQLAATSPPCTMNQVDIRSHLEEPSALDHFYGKTGTLSVLVLAAPVWITKCPYILSVCLSSTICVSNNRSHHPTTLVSEVGHANVVRWWFI